MTDLRLSYVEQKAPGTKRVEALKTIVFPNSRQTTFFPKKLPCNGSKYSFRKTKFNLFEADE
jgi:hypothetical protein